MNLFLLNVLLALLWAAITGTFTAANIAIGFFIGLIVVAVGGRALGKPRYLETLLKSIGLVLFFLKELLSSSLRVAYDIVTPKHHMKPAIIAVPLDVEKDLQITMLANLVSLTPGTLSLDVSKDKKTLFVHAMYADDTEAIKRTIKHDFESRIKEVIR
ncbi:MAG: Na+/H+ antiporter subunit E [Trueperaceae bacterium]|nr:Na+/H+ antiporter subunit E [Trueperaceae bacterium]